MATSTESRRKNHKISAARRQIERRHRCESCQEIFACDACSDAATLAGQRLRDNIEDGVVLYGGDHLRFANATRRVFLCDECKAKRRKRA